MVGETGRDLVPTLLRIDVGSCWWCFEISRDIPIDNWPKVDSPCPQNSKVCLTPTMVGGTECRVEQAVEVPDNSKH